LLRVAHDIFLTHEFSSPAERVFAALDDHANMGSWLGSRISVVKRADDGGVGTVRRIHAPLGHFDEEIVERDVPSRMVYRIVSRVPGLSFHRGEIKVDAAGPGRSVVRWHVQIDSKLPGFSGLILRVVGFALKRGLVRLDRQLAA
jgi:uncharacterized protein YndB with AHSA1/START domain